MSLITKGVPLRWVVAEHSDFDRIQKVSEQVGLDKTVVTILFNRQIDTPEAISEFLNPKLSDLQDPFNMFGMEAAIDRILTALRENEKIMVYGDYDVDGITATSLLYLVLNKLGAQVIYYLPNRLVEGYGLSIEGIKEAESKGISLIVSVDTGVTAVSA